MVILNDNVSPDMMMISINERESRVCVMSPTRYL
jgi:hypothetical protein